MARICFSTHSEPVSFCGKLAMKSFRGMPAWRTARAMIWRSWLRMPATARRRLLHSSSNIFGASFSCMNSSVSWPRVLRVFACAGPSLASRVFTCLCSRPIFFMRRATSAGSGPVSASLAESSSSSSSSSAAAFLPLPLALAFSFSFAFSFALSSARLPGWATSSVWLGSMKPTTRSARRASPAATAAYWFSRNSMVPGNSDRAWRTCSRPSSMRLAMRISPSRVSSSTVPISRMYMRTGSVVRPNSLSTVASAAAASSAVVVVGRHGGVGQQQFLGIRRLLVDRDAHVVDHVDDVFDLLRIDDVVREVIVDFAIGQVTLLLAAGDQQLDLGLLLIR